MSDLKGLHILLTYTCLYECDHCFLHCGPNAEGTFTIERMESLLDQAVEAGIESLFFEGGEPFLFFPLLEASVRLGRERGLSSRLVTNGYWATSLRDAELWLAPLQAAGLASLSISEDVFHGDDDGPARRVRDAAGNLGLEIDSISIEPPATAADATQGKGEPVVGGDVLLKGRAVDKLVDGLPRRPYACFTECTGEELARPSRVHLDPHGNVFVCQGLSIGNVWRTPLAEVMKAYDPAAHPVVGPLLEGGPAALARRYGLPEGEDYVSDCHLCYLVRRGLVDRFPEQLCPRQVYGLPAG